MKNALPNKSIILSIEKIIFHSEDNDGVVLSGKESNGKTRQVVGTLSDPKIGSIIKATGFWKRHDRYGWQFKAEDIAVLSQDPVNDPREALQCRITFVKELRQDTGFCSASGIMKDDSKVRLSGRLKNMSPGIEAYALGEWHEDEKYGREFRVKQWEYFKPERPGTLQKCLEMISAIKASNDKTSKIHEFSWNEVEMKDDMVVIPYPEGQTTWCSLPGSRESYNRIKSYLADRLSALQVSFDSKGFGMVLNASVMREAVTLMHVTHTLRYGEMEPREKNRDIMEVIGEMSPEATREFVPRDVTRYLDFLQDKQSEYFNIVPIEEYNGGSREDAFLFTVMIGDRPCIVWENTNPSRATFVFPCTEESYNEKIQTVCNFIADERTGKRQYLHSDACNVTFGEKPVLLAHNTFESWSERLMAING